MSIAGEALPGLGRWELLPPAVSLQIQLCERQRGCDQFCQVAVNQELPRHDPSFVPFRIALDRHARSAFDPSCPAYDEAIDQLLQDGMIVPVDGHYALHPQQTLGQALAVADIVKR